MRSEKMASEIVGDVIENPKKQTSYRVKSLLCEGGFGKVYVTESERTRRELAIKLTPTAPDHISRRTALNETAILKKLTECPARSDNVLLGEDIFEWNQHSCLVMQKLNYDLFDVIVNQHKSQPLDLSTIRHFSRQIFCGLRFLHDLTVIHADLKPENIMIEEDGEHITLKIIDFGAAFLLRDSSEMANSLRPTLNYMSPEILYGLPLCQKTDIFSMGLIMSEMYKGRCFFNVSDEFQLTFLQRNVIGTPRNVIKGLKTSIFMTMLDNGENRLKTEKEHEQEGVTMNKKGIYDKKLVTDMIHSGFNDRLGSGATKDDYSFLNMMEGLLNVDVDDRMDVHDALQHPFLRNSSTSSTDKSICP